MDLFEMMAKAGERERLIAQGRMMGLTDEQARLVVDTLGPAALAGLQRAQADIGAVMRDMTAMGERMMRGEGAVHPFAASPAASVFGSPEAAEAVADQIARMTGADREAMRQLVPAFSASLLAQMAVVASLPAMAPMKDALQRAMGAFGGAQASRPGTAPEGRAPDVADVMAPMTEFVKGMSAMMEAAAKPRAAPDADAKASDAEGEAGFAHGNQGSGATALPSLNEALEAQTRAWNAFLAGLAKTGRSDPERP